VGFEMKLQEKFEGDICEKQYEKSNTERPDALKKFAFWKEYDRLEKVLRDYCNSCNSGCSSCGSCGSSEGGCSGCNSCSGCE